MMESLNYIKRLNKYAFIVHLLSAVGLIVLYSMRYDNANFDTNLYSFQVKKVEGENDDKISYSFGNEGDPKLDVSLFSIKTLIILIFGITALFHFYYWKSNNYNTELSQGFNRYRWLEYSITATVMIFVLSIISGTKELYSAFQLCAITIALMCLGFFLEQTDKFQVKLICLILGWFLLTVTFVVLISRLQLNLSQVNKNEPDIEIPGWIKFVLFPMLLWWASFGIVGFIQTLNYKKENYTFLTYEKWYILLSFLSKLFMGYYISFGITRDKNERKNLIFE